MFFRSIVFLSFALLRAVDVRSAGLVLNELVSSNQTGIQDEDGDRPDWIELHNDSEQGVNTFGYSLSDDPANPRKWVLPPLVVSPGEYLLVFASGKDRGAHPLRLHANFSIRASGEGLLLSGPKGERIDQFSAITIPSDVSYGRSPTDRTEKRFFVRPTPRTQNSGPSFPRVVAPPKFSVPGGDLEADTKLILTAADSGVTIRFSTDGTEPGPESSVYREPIVLRDRSPDPDQLALIMGTSTTNQHTDGWNAPSANGAKAMVVRARAFQEGSLSSEVATRTWWVGTGRGSGAGLPRISLVTDTNGLFGYERGIYMLGKIFDDYQAAHPGEALTGHSPANYQARGDAWERMGHAEFEGFAPESRFEVPVRVKIAGQSTRSFRQKSFSLHALGTEFASGLFPGRRGKGTGEPLAGYSHVRLSNSGNDWAHTMFRDALCHELMDGWSVDNLAYRPCALFLDGEYWGIHNLREEQNLNGIVAHHGVPPGEVILCEGNGVLVAGRPGDETGYFNLREYIRTNDLNLAEHQRHIEKHIDVDNFLIYHAAEIYFGNADWPQNNIRFWKTRTHAAGPRNHDGRWRWMLHDVDLGLGHPWSGGVDADTLEAATTPGGRPGLDAQWSTVMLRKILLANPYRDRFLLLMSDLLNTTFREERVSDVIDGVVGRLSPAIPEHIRRWRTMNDSPEGWTNEVRVVRNFVSQRPFYVRQQLNRYFKLSGFSVLTVDVMPKAAGEVRIHEVFAGFHSGTESGSVYPWRGRYPRDIDVPIEAVPKPGWRFAGWHGLTDSPLPKSRITLKDASTLTARFEPIEIRMDSIRRSPENRLELTLSGPPGLAFEVESSKDLKFWGLAGQGQIRTSGTANVAFTSLEDDSSRFFRIRIP